MATKSNPTKPDEKTSAPKAQEAKKAEAQKVEAQKVDAKKAPAKKAASGDDAPAKGKKIDKPAKGHKPNALQQPLQPSEELAAVVGTEKLARGEAVSKVWTYIKEHKLQNPKDGREILADDKLSKVFGKDKVTMFEMNKHLAQHLK